jgi:death-on-curing protein
MGENPAPLMGGGREKLESAVATPQWAALHAEADLAEQAALLTVRIAQAHALVDNNKRLAYIVGVIFLRENGQPLPAEHAMTFARHIERALEHSVTVDDITSWLRGVL